MEIKYANSNRVGCFRILRDNAIEPAFLKALHALITPLHKEPDDTGRGVMFFAASDLFEPIEEGAEVPEYRIEAVYDGHFEAPDWEARRVNSGRFGFVAIRKIVVRVPTAHITHVAPPVRMH